VWRALYTFERRSSFRTFVHTIVLHRIYAEARPRKSRITITQVEELPEREATDPGFDRFPLDRFTGNERHLLSTFARLPNFARAAAELGITPKTLRSRWAAPFILQMGDA
jgi:DNA-directed RNA polymerase specialized sigma24 family protein